MSGQPAALLDEHHEEFGRYHDPAALRAAYAARPRTRVHEHINHATPHAWYSLAAQHLGRLSATHLQVVCSVFESAHGDESLGPHYDTWYWRTGADQHRPTGR